MTKNVCTESAPRNKSVSPDGGPQCHAAVAQHTRAPWVAECIGVTDAGPNGQDVYEIISADGYARICEGITEANAARIVLCVNAHDELVAACDEALNALLCSIPAGGADDRKVIADAKARLRAALARSAKP